MMPAVPTIRIRRVNAEPGRASGDYVLYWMIAFRRAGWNFSLQRAVEWCQELKKPLVVLEALRCGYEWASDRLHRFVLQGMAENRNRFAGSPVRYYGIFWVLGRFDRPWWPERPVYGVVRYMSSENTARKLRLKRYLARFDGRGLDQDPVDPSAVAARNEKGPFSHDD